MFEPPRAIGDDWSAAPEFIREYLTNSLHHLAALATPAPGASTPGG